MSNPESSALSKSGEMIPVLLYLLGGLAVFLVSMTFVSLLSTDASIWLRAGLSILFLGMAAIFHRSPRLSEYWQIPFMLFVAVFSQFLSWYFSGRILSWTGLDVSTVEGVAVAKLIESTLIVAPIILFVGMSGAGLGSVYIRKGKLGLSLVIGVVSFVVLALLAVWSGYADGISLESMIGWTPWILLFVLSNGFMEELLFRGLFLGKLSPIVGAGLANLLTTIVFVSAHSQLTYSPDLVMFLAILFVLSLAWGYVMQKTDNIWGSALFHAGADCFVLIWMFGAM